MRYTRPEARLPKFRANFFRTEAGAEPVRVKKTQRTPNEDIKRAEKRWKDWRHGKEE